MIPKSMTTLEGVAAAADPTLFLKFKADGVTVDWDATRAYLSVYCNKRRAEETYSDPFTISISGAKNIMTVATHVRKGSNIDRVQCFLSVEKQGCIGKRADGTPKKKADGSIVFENVMHLHMQNIELGTDSKGILEEKLIAEFNALIAQGTVVEATFNAERPAVMGAVSRAISNKPKNQAFDLATVRAARKYGYMRVWVGGSKEEGGHFLDESQPAAANTGDVNLGVLGEISAEEAAMIAEVRKQKEDAAGGAEAAF